METYFVDRSPRFAERTISRAALGPWRRMAEFAGIVFVYVALARLGQVAAIPPGNITPIYPAAGFGLACVLLRGWRVWPAIWIGQFLGNAWAFIDFSGWGALAITSVAGAATSFGAVLQVIVGAYLIARSCGTSNPFSKLRHLFWFVGMVGIACLISASVGVTGLSLSGVIDWKTLGYSWSTWYLGDFVGVILFVPICTTWAYFASHTRKPIEMIEIVVVLSLVAAFSLSVHLEYLALETACNILLFMTLPLIIWAALRLGQPGVAVLAAIICALSAFATVQGFGPFATDDPIVALLLLQFFMVVVMITGLSLAITVDQLRCSEASLRTTTASLSKIRFAIDKAGDAVFLVRPNASFEYVNDQATTLTGYAREELLSMAVCDIDPNFPVLGWPEFWREKIQNKLLYFESTVQRKDSTDVPVEISVNHFNIDGKELACAIVKDVSEQRQAKESLQLVQAQRVTAQRAVEAHQCSLQQILDNTSAVIYVKDLNGRYEFVNNRWGELFHIQPEDVNGKTDQDLFPAEMAEAFRRNDLHVLKTGEGLQIEEVAPHDDGPHTYVSVKFPLRDAEGRVRGLAGISTDISEQLAAKDELENLKRRLELMLDSVSDGIYGLDTEGRITFANRAAENLLGWPASKMLGRRQHELVHRSDPGEPHPVTSCPVYETIREGTSHYIDHDKFSRADGESIPVEYASLPIVDKEQIMGAVVTFRDLTGRMRQLRQEQELLTAHIVQQALYPKEPPSFPGFDVAGAVSPATDACGDYFDFIPVEEGLVLAVGDVASHGLGPALQMTETRGFLRASLDGESDLVEVVHRLNELLVQDMPDGGFMSLLLAHLGSTGRTLEFVGAGHDAWLVRANGNTCRLDSTGIPLGIMSDAPIESATAPSMETGDLLLITTDGVVETHSPQQELFGYQRMLDVVTSQAHLESHEIVDHLIAAVREFAQSESFADDVTVVVAKAT